MSKNIIRNSHEMKKFAKQIDDYAAGIRNECKALKAQLSKAEPGMKDDISKKARDKLEALADSMVKRLPGVEEIAVKLRASAAKLDQASGIKI